MSVGWTASPHLSRMRRLERPGLSEGHNVHAAGFLQDG
jgi:hypothetical protein